MRAACPGWLVLVAACGRAPYAAYWDEGAGPTLASVEPGEVASTSGGDEVVIRGTGLASAEVVVFGARNAEIVAATDEALTVRVPATIGAGSVEVGVVTASGAARLPGGLTYHAAGEAVSADEQVSISLVVVDCPAEALAWWDEEWYPLGWCGYEQGYAVVAGIAGADHQPGFAADLSGLAPVSALPAAGEVVVWHAGDPEPPRLPDRYGRFTDGDAFVVSTPRDLARDLAWIEARVDELARTYTWWDDVTTLEPIATVFDGESCWLDDLSLDGASGDVLDGALDGATGAWLGMYVEEGDGAYVGEGYTGTATLQPDAGGLRAGASGTVLAWDDYSGRLTDPGVAGFLGPSDLPLGARFDVAFDRSGQTFEMGSVDGVQALELLQPDLMGGLTQIVRGEPLTLTWVPAPASDDPVWIAIDVTVRDFSYATPVGVPVVARLLVHADDAAGQLVLPGDALAELPDAANAYADDDLVGLWGEITVARHQLRRVPFGFDGMVLDFVHAVQVPIDVASP